MKLTVTNSTFPIEKNQIPVSIIYSGVNDWKKYNFYYAKSIVYPNALSRIMINIQLNVGESLA